MRVTHVITRLIVGGAQENTIATVLGLQAKADLQVDLISGPTSGPEGSLEATLHPGSICLRRVRNDQLAEGDDAPAGGRCSPLLTIIPELVRPIRPWLDCRALQKLTKIFHETKPDIVHTHSGKAGILGRLAARRAGVPIILHTIHGPSFGSFQNSFANFIFRSAEKYAAQCTTHFISVADAMTKDYLAAGIGSPKKYTRIFSGFSLEPFLTASNDLSFRKELGIEPEDFVVGKIARLFELKGHDDLFVIAPQLVRRFPQTKFLLVGDGLWRNRFELRACALGLEKNFIFTGLISPNEVPRHVGIMNALVHLSRREGLPRALPQALAAARPVITYDCDGANEVCIPNETGFLVRPGDKEDLTEKIIRLINDPTLCKRLGGAGQAMVKNNFSVEQMVETIFSLYVKLTAQSATEKGRYVS